MPDEVLGSPDGLHFEERAGNVVVEGLQVDHWPPCPVRLRDNKHRADKSHVASCWDATLDSRSCISAVKSLAVS